MIRDVLRDHLVRRARARRSDLSVAAYCHAFDVRPEAVPDGGRRPEDPEA